MSKKTWLTCIRCGKKWRCKDAEKCKVFNNSGTCQCDSCYKALDEACEEVESFNEAREVVIFT